MNLNMLLHPSTFQGETLSSHTTYIIRCAVESESQVINSGSVLSSNLTDYRYHYT